MKSTNMTKRRWIVLALCIAVAILLLVWIVGSKTFFPARDYTWQTMQQRRVWRVGTDPSFPPFEQLDATGKPVGYDIDLAQHIAAAWGMRVEIVAIGFDSLLDALQTGQIDSVISALPYDERLTKNVIYSSAYFEAGIRLAVRKNSKISSVEQLAKHKVAVEWGSTGDMVGRRLQHEKPTIQLVQFSTPAEAVAALVNDQTIDALFVDQVTLRAAQGKGAPVIAVGPALESNSYVIALPHTATVLQTQLEKTLQELQANGLPAQLETQWFDRTN